MKTCTICSTEKDVAEFRKGRNQCKACLKERAKKYYEANSDKVKKYREANSDKANARDKKYREANSDKVKKYQKKYYEANSDKVKKYKKKYREANSDKECAAGAAYRARLKANLVEDVDYSLIRKEATTCYLCFIPFTEEELHDGKLTHVDHKVPISRGGKHSCENTALTHTRCNLSKGAKTPEEYFEWAKAIKEYER